MPKTDELKTGVLYRTATIDRAAIDEDKRTVELSFSSERPYKRYFGTEILSHKKGHVEMDFIGSGRAPLLVGHWSDDLVGVVEKATIGADRTGRAVVRFGKSQRADEIFADVLDGIRLNVSVGYHIKKMVLEKDDEEEGRTYRATLWRPLEVSLVPIPADDSVGVGRQMRSAPDVAPAIIETKGEKTMPEPVTTAPATAPATAAPAAPAVDIKQITADVQAREATRVSEIIAIGEGHGMQAEALAAVKDGTALDDFRQIVLAKMVERGKATPTKQTDGDIGLTDKEVQQFRICRMINALANPTDRAAREAAAFEFEATAATAAKMGRQAQGFFVPPEVLRGQRDMTAGTDAAGGYLVGTDLMAADFIELLRAKLTLRALGARVLTGLQGNVAIPKLAGGVTTAWVAEATAATESTPTIGQLGLTPKTISANTDLSRRLIIQSSLDVENMVREDMAGAIALGIDLAGIAGTGADNQPTGILNTTGIGAVVCGDPDGAAPTWGDVVNLETEVAVDNADVGSLGYLTNPKVRGKLKQTEKAANTAQFVWPDMPIEQQIVNGYRAMVTNAVPSDGTKGTGTALSAMIFGNFADIILGFWSVVDIIVDPYTNSKSGNVSVTALQDADVGVRHAESFAAFTDAVTT